MSARITISNRPVRLKKSGQPHQQIWLQPTPTEYVGRVKLPASATLDEVMCQVTRASLSPAHYSFLQRPNRFEFGRATLKLRDCLDRLRPTFAIPMKRIASAIVTVITLTHASLH